MNRSILFIAIAFVILAAACKKDENKVPPEASFDINPEFAEVGVTISFQSTCQNATSFDWNFGDGSSSSEENPTHVYATSGIYNVILTASNEDGSAVANKPLDVTPKSPCWTRLNNLPDARRQHISVALNERIYVIGGTKREIHVYDPSTDTWTSKAILPTARRSLSGCVINGKIYAIGGFSGTFQIENHSTVEVYDPASDTWTEKTSMPTERSYHASIAFDGKIFVFGGIKFTDEYELFNTIEIYDPETDSWTSKEPGGDYFVPKFGQTVCSVNGKIYAIGGCMETSQPFNPLKTVQVYDPVANTWENKSGMPTARITSSVAVVNDRIYVIGGGDVDNIFPTVEAYDPLTDTWETKSSLPVSLDVLAASAQDQLIYVSGGWGWDSEENVYFFVYDPACDAVSKK